MSYPGLLECLGCVIASKFEVYYDLTNETKYIGAKFGKLVTFWLFITRKNVNGLMIGICNFEPRLNTIVDISGNFDPATVKVVIWQVGFTILEKIY